MAKSFNFILDLSYDLETGYTSLVKSRELITQYAVRFNVIIKNDSKKDFPGTKLHSTIVEHGSSVGQEIRFRRREGVDIQKIEKGSKTTVLVGPEYTPLLPGLLELRLEFLEPEGIEINIGKSEGIPTQRRTVRYLFNTIDWHELEKLRLLKRLGRGSKNVKNI